WFGWFGFNGASQLAAGSIGDINSVAIIFANTNTAAAGGVLAAMALTSLLYGKMDATLVFNGAIGGLVSITAEPLTPSMFEALLIGGIGGVLVVLTVPLLDRFKVDDVVGAIPAHLVCGIWGTLIVAINTQSVKSTISSDEALARASELFPGLSASEAATAVTDALNDDGEFEFYFSILEQLGIQGIGVVATGVFVCAASLIVWLALKHTVGVRVSEEEETEGLDKSEVGLEAYPDFAA
ncbi:MAG: hypothetical protein AAFQ67_01540, partial [Pseudomonadota bacterium]